MTAYNDFEISSRRVFGRSRGKKLSNRQQECYDKLIFEYAVFQNLTLGELKSDLKEKLNLAFDRPNIILEVGFGSGENIVTQAQRMPETTFIGCEQYKNGVAKLLTKIDDQQLSNIMIHEGDARDVFDSLPDHCVDELYLLYPDPWPKKKHSSRRFITQETLDQVSKVLKNGGLLFVATDIEVYVSHVLETMLHRVDFFWKANSKNDWKLPWKNWEKTRYEEKAFLANRTPYYLIFQKE